ncbi:hypothetical protein [Nocardioides yefusunii]|uniref:Uncharacterized protein n=1 Tax=Nocardioides yefusunii TaxID=2500546 RepID=A0ABW1QUY9_9ACTN|nr:hypothetical protein [Nocardioides yefusunii]
MSDEASHEQPGAPDGVGSLAQEAAKFAGAFATWAVQHGSDVTHQAADLAGQVREGVKESVKEHVHEADAHFATGSAECTVCPVCRTVAAVREVSPEVKAHLTTAATSLVAVASTLLSTVAEARHAARPDTAPPPTAPPSSARPTQETPVEHIDLDPEA